MISRGQDVDDIELIIDVKSANVIGEKTTKKVKQRNVWLNKHETKTKHSFKKQAINESNDNFVIIISYSNIIS